MESQPNGPLVADPKLRKLAVAKLWAELHVAHKNNDDGLAEEIEYQALMILLAAQQVLKVLAARKDHNP